MEIYIYIIGIKFFIYKEGGITLSFFFYGFMLMISLLFFLMMREKYVSFALLQFYVHDIVVSFRVFFFITGVVIVIYLWFCFAFVVYDYYHILFSFFLSLIFLYYSYILIFVISDITIFFSRFSVAVVIYCCFVEGISLCCLLLSSLLFFMLFLFICFIFTFFPKVLTVAFIRDIARVCNLKETLQVQDNG